ncbi:MAG: hypothetical protein A2X04_07440 [Bacteroidetes bacterium GWF2_41_9]|nr:MAG: hypothetical protein A2X04_07440 [Bacteroidetes bacterium GWF2_41_9]
MIIIGTLYYKSQKNRIFREQEVNLSTIASLKIKQIQQWHSQRLGDAAIIRDNTPLILQIKQFFKDENQPEVRRNLIKLMESINREYDYNGVSLVDITMKAKLSVSSSDSVTVEGIEAEIGEVIKNQKIILADLYKTGSLNKPHIDLLVPLIDPESIKPTQFGVAILRIDPQEIIFPLINKWPTQSKSSETLLIRQEGDSILYLNELRHQKNTALNLRLPLTNKNLLGAKAIGGSEGISEGVDYRGIPVIGYLTKIPGLTWYMVTKIDIEELQTPIRRFLIIAIIVTVLLILMNGAIFGFWIWNQKIILYRRQLKNELARQALEHHFEYLFKYANDIIILFDNHLSIVEINESALKTYGYKREEMIGMKKLKLMAPSTLKLLTEQIKILDDKSSAFYETLHIRKDGSEFPIEISARVIEMEGSKYYQLIGRDISERRRADETLRASEECYRSLVENIDFGVSMIDKDFKIIMTNTLMGRWFNKPACKFVGENCFKEFEKRQAICQHCPGVKAMASGRPHQAETEGILEDGSRLSVLVHAFPLSDPDGVARGFIEVVEDITERKKKEEELLRAKEKAEESDRFKTAFLQNMSHEIRTPLNAILGFSELLQDPKISQEDSRFFIEQIHFSKDDLLDLVENVVFAAKYDTKQFVSTNKKFNLNDSLNKLVSDSKKLTHRNDKSHIVFLSRLESTKDITIEADENNVKMALRQLISNAIKYTDSGQIEIGTKLIDNSEVEFYIKDTGIGIDKYEYEKIFDRFYKVESNSNKLFRGAGIGLTIVKGIAETLGGNVRVDSIVGEGTTFYFSIPVIVIGIESKKQQPQSDISNIISKWGERNILIAEDVDTNLKYLDKVLDFSNITRFHAKNGQEAVEIIKTNKIDLVLMDILMPVMDGYEAATIIRTLFPSIPIIAQTAIYSKTDRDADLLSLFNDYLIKPINRNSLVELLDKFLKLQD